MYGMPYGAIRYPYVMYVVCSDQAGSLCPYADSSHSMPASSVIARAIEDESGKESSVPSAQV